MALRTRLAACHSVRFGTGPYRPEDGTIVKMGESFKAWCRVKERPMSSQNQTPKPDQNEVAAAAEQFAAQALKSAMERALDGLLVFDALERKQKPKD